MRILCSFFFAILLSLGYLLHLFVDAWVNLFLGLLFVFILFIRINAKFFFQAVVNAVEIGLRVALIKIRALLVMMLHRRTPGVMNLDLSVRKAVSCVLHGVSLSASWLNIFFGEILSQDRNCAVAVLVFVDRDDAAWINFDGIVIATAQQTR